MLTIRAVVVFASLLGASFLSAQDEAGVTVLLGKLQSQNIEMRHQAIRELQTSLDPRIPDACLPVLKMEGDSIRRLAARAIGSRWHQIPKDRVPVFLAALKEQSKSEHDGLKNMARRGIALLKRDYRDAMVSRSHGKRWVIYERHGLPCLIDTANGTEELLGFGGGGMLNAAYGNEEVTSSVVWHPKKDLVALDIIEGRKDSTVWVWVHGKGLRQFSRQETLKALGEPKGVHRPGGFFTNIVGWKGDGLDFTVSFVVQEGEDYLDREATLRWNSANDKLELVGPFR